MKRKKLRHNHSRVYILVMKPNFLTPIKTIPVTTTLRAYTVVAQQQQTKKTSVLKFSISFRKIA